MQFDLSIPKLESASKRRQARLKKYTDKVKNHVERVEVVVQTVIDHRRTEKTVASGRLQKRMIDANRRRSEHLSVTRHRARSGSQKRDSEEIQSKTDLDAGSTYSRFAEIIQVWWRDAQLAHDQLLAFLAKHPLRLIEIILGAFTTQGPESFESMAKHLANPDVQNAAKRLVQCVFMVSKNTRVSTANNRAFLSFMMIDRCPEVVIHDSGNQPSGTREKMEKELRNNASLMSACIRYLHRKLYHRSSSGIHTGLKVFRICHTRYIKSFTIWKQIDKICLTEELRVMYNQLFSSSQEILELEKRADVKDPGFEQLLDGITNQLNSLRVRLVALNGEENTQTWINTMTSDFAPQVVQEMVPDYQSVPARPSIFVPSNEQLLQELLLDGNFRLSLNYDHGIYATSCESLARDLMQGNNTSFLDAIAHIRDRIAALTPNREDLIGELHETLDVELLEQQMQQDAFGNEALFQMIKFMGDKILSLQASCRRANTTGWLKNMHQMFEEGSAKDPQWWRHFGATSMKRVISDIRYVELDLVNYHMTALMSHVSGGEAMRYIRSKFECHSCYSNGCPPITVQWLKDVFESSTVELPNPQTCVLGGFLGLLSRSDVTAFPETMWLDVSRLKLLNNRIADVTMLATIELLVKQVLRAHEGLDVQSDHQEMVAGLTQLQNVYLSKRNILDVMPILVSTMDKVVSSEKNGQQLSKYSETALRAMVSQASQGVLFRAILRQFELIIRRLIQQPNQSICNLVQKGGLVSQEKNVHDICATTTDLFHVHWKTYCNLYEDIVATITKENIIQ